MQTTCYAIALGSNRRHGRHGHPAKVIDAAIAMLAAEGILVEARSATLATPALGPAGRAFANAAAVVRTSLSPEQLLRLLKCIESRFGRRRGRRWGPRVLDLDIVLWSEGHARVGRSLTIPHREFRRRRFVLDTLVQVTPGWRDTITALTVRHLHVRLARHAPVDRATRAQ